MTRDLVMLARTSPDWELGPDPFVEGATAACRVTSFGVFAVRPTRVDLVFPLGPPYEVWHFSNAQVSKCVRTAMTLESIDEDLMKLERGDSEKLKGRWDEEFLSVIGSREIPKTS